MCSFIFYKQRLLMEGCSKTSQTSRRHNTPHETWQSATAPGNQPDLLQTHCHVQAEHEPCSFLRACDLPARHHSDFRQPALANEVIRGRATDGKKSTDLWINRATFIKECFYQPLIDNNRWDKRAHTPQLQQTIETLDRHNVGEKVFAEML